MNPERWKRLSELFEQAAKLPPEQWRAFLDVAAGDDRELADEVLGMLQARANSNFIEPPTVGGGMAPPPESDRWIGRVLGDFELLAEIGSGGMGVVFRARQLSLGRDVAVKVLPPSPLLQARHIARFEKEARSAAKLHHPNVVAIHSVGRAAELLYFAMELVDGPDLAKELLNLAGGDATPPVRLPRFDSPDYVTTVVRIVEQAADALAYAHENQVVHRDIKPHNLLLDPHGNVRVVDFGLARDEAQGSITETGEQGGTPHYMSPEQVRTSLHTVDARTDVYSLGVVLFELLTLRRPYTGATRNEIYDRIKHADAPRLRKLAPRVPRDLELVCNTAMARELPERYPSAAEFRDDLRRFLRHEAVVARAPSVARRARKFARRHRLPLLAGTAAIVALAFGFEFAALRAQDESLARDTGAFERALALPTLEDWDAHIEEIVDARTRFLALEPRRDRLPRTLSDLITKLGKRFNDDLQQRRTKGEALEKLGLGGTRSAATNGGYGAPPSERDLARAQQVFERASTIYFDRRDVRALADARRTYPRVLLDVDARTRAEIGDAVAMVTARPIDPLIGVRGEAVVLGDTPLDTRLEPGNWRFIVNVPGFGFAEYTRFLLARADPYVIDVRVRRDQSVLRDPDVAGGMKLIASGTYAFDKARPMACDVAGPTADFEGFYIDTAEVSNAEYLQFMRETHAAAPFRWRECGYSDDWRALPLGDYLNTFLDLPVAGIDCLEAQAYAEWAGKRLPTHLELERALRGPDGARFPWPDAERSDRFGACNIDGPDIRVATSPLDRLRCYVANVRPVRDPRFRQGPEQLFHAFGNVAEFTESLLAEPQEGVLVTKPWERVYLGASWDAAMHNDSLDFHATTGVGDRYAMDTVGIRCVRSCTP